MNPTRAKKISKFLSLILRHEPQAVGVELDESGWTPVDHLLVKMNEAGTFIDRELLEQIVRNNPKKRFAFSDCNTLIRANQGHSIDVELGYDPVEPPQFLFHGAATKDLKKIRSNGLKKMKRHDVHLNSATEPCIAIGSRHGKPTVLKIAAKEMYHAGFQFFRTPNDVWLTNNVPPEFIAFED